MTCRRQKLFVALNKKSIHPYQLLKDISAGLNYLKRNYSSYILFCFYQGYFSQEKTHYTKSSKCPHLYSLHYGASSSRWPTWIRLCRARAQRWAQRWRRRRGSVDYRFRKRGRGLLPSGSGDRDRWIERTESDHTRRCPVIKLCYVYTVVGNNSFRMIANIAIKRM